MYSMMGEGVELFPYKLSGGRVCFEVLSICVSDIKFTALHFLEAMFLNMSSKFSLLLFPKQKVTPKKSLLLRVITCSR